MPTSRPLRIALACSLLAGGCAFDEAGYYPGSDAGGGYPPPPMGGSDAGAPFSDAGPGMGADAGEPPTTEQFDDVGSNPYVMAAHDPFSTFAADVDTASYDIFVRDATGGRLPDPASVRLDADLGPT